MELQDTESLISFVVSNSGRELKVLQDALSMIYNTVEHTKKQFTKPPAIVIPSPVLSPVPQRSICSMGYSYSLPEKRRHVILDQLVEHHGVSYVSSQLQKLAHTFGYEEVVLDDLQRVFRVHGDPGTSM